MLLLTLICFVALPVFYRYAVFNFVYTRRIKRARQIDSFTSLNGNTKNTFHNMFNWKLFRSKNTRIFSSTTPLLARKFNHCLKLARSFALSLLIVLLILFFAPQKDVINKGNSHNLTLFCLPLLYKLLIEFNLQSKFRVYTEIRLCASSSSSFFGDVFLRCSRFDTLFLLFFIILHVF